MNKATEKTSPASGVDLSHTEVERARKEGALEAVKEAGRRAALADTGTQGNTEAMAEAESKRLSPDANTTQIAPLLDLPLTALSPRLSNDKVPDPISVETAKGLLALERAGRNRTDYVKALCERIGVDSPFEVTAAGPAYTNDVSDVTLIKQ